MAEAPRRKNGPRTRVEAPAAGSNGGATAVTGSGRPSGSGVPVAPDDDIKSGLPALQVPPTGTGAPPASGEWWGAFTIGESVGKPAANLFQLAPRLYVLSRGDAGGRAAAHAGQGPKPFDDLPQHLIFRESPSEGADRMRQTWFSEDGGEWSWELVVERHDGSLRATLSATARAATAGSSRFVWTGNGGWDAFGTNRMEPELAGHGVPPLFVAAP